MAKAHQTGYNNIMENSQLVADAERLAEGLGALPEPAARPSLVVVSGLPGTGKSYFSARLAERAGFVILESDALRKVLFPSPDYSAASSARLFRAIHLLVERLLRRGISVILDATNLFETHREHLYSIAERTEAKLILVEVRAPPEVVHARMEERRSLRSQGAAVSSDADWSVYLQMEPSVEPIRRRHYVVDTSQEISPVIDKILKEINTGNGRKR